MKVMKSSIIIHIRMIILLIKNNNYFHNNCIEQIIFLSYLDQWDSLDIQDLAQHLKKECN